MNSIIVPAFNEEERSLKFIPHLLAYVKKHIHSSEIIIVDDGSSDRTVDVVKKMIIRARAQKIAKVIGYSKNKGKGNAVAFGVKHAKGTKILFIDADGSIQPDEIPKMLTKLDMYDVVVGDRHSARSKIKTTILRKITSGGFNRWVSIIFGYSYRDNLCGFKGFKRHVAKTIFANLRDKRWVFDVELFYKIKKKGYSLYFLPIKWKHVEGSRINVIRDSVVWFLRLLRLRYVLRNYR